MPWTSKFQRPIVLKDGRKIATLADARDLLLALPEPHRRRPHVVYAAQMLIGAAERRGVANARAQMSRALIVEGCSNCPGKVLSPYPI
jgi:hypothetical protein